jgi:hypothetical protein
MPVHVDIRVNEQFIKTIHIGHLIGTTDPDSVNTYIAIETDEPFTPCDKLPWNEGKRFNHRYGDGIDRCVQKAMTTLAIFTDKRQFEDHCEHMNKVTVARLTEAGLPCPECGVEQ